MAGATQERTLLGVGSSAWFGMALTTIVVPSFSKPPLTTPSVIHRIRPTESFLADNIFAKIG
jgi:hypothetical protein